MSPTVAHKKRALRKELSYIQDPFSLLADALIRNEELEDELNSLRARMPVSPT